MDKKENFKLFVSKHPELLGSIKSKEMSWQDYYEIYDIYGEDMNTWNKYFNENKSDRDINQAKKITELTSIFKNINMDNIQHYVNNAQKAINIIQELTKKTPEVVAKNVRPITKFYGD